MSDCRMRIQACSLVDCSLGQKEWDVFLHCHPGDMIYFKELEGGMWRGEWGGQRERPNRN